MQKVERKIPSRSEPKKFHTVVYDPLTGKMTCTCGKYIHIGSKNGTCCHHQEQAVREGIMGERQ